MHVILAGAQTDRQTDRQTRPPEQCEHGSIVADCLMYPLKNGSNVGVDGGVLVSWEKEEGRKYTGRLL